MNKKDQFKRFIKKDGFYVVLFVCLCLVATVGVVVANKSTNNTVEENIAENTIEIQRIIALQLVILLMMLN